MRYPDAVPVLTDGVVTLRAHIVGDVDDIVTMCQDPETARWTAVPSPYTHGDALAFVGSIMRIGWEQKDFRGWAIEAIDDTATPRFAGNVDVRGTPIADIGFVLHPWARGRGLMKRAIDLAVDWAFAEGGVEIVHWAAHVGNEASLRVAHACGFTLGGTTAGRLNERGRVLDAWTAWRRFGDSPLPRTRWVGDAVIEGRRVRLRPFRESDEARLVEACRDPLSQHWLAGLPQPYTTASARAHVAASVWAAAAGTTATWCVADRETDALLGNIAVMDLGGVDPGQGEIGYWMHPDARGRGLMTEAARLVVDHALDPAGLDLRRIALYAAEGNVASHAIAGALRMRHTGVQTAAEPLGDGSFADLHGYELVR